MIKVEQKKFTSNDGWQLIRSSGIPAEQYDLVLVFGSTTLLSNENCYRDICQAYPKSEIVLNSTAGEIIDTQVNDESLSLTALKFESTRVKTLDLSIDETKDSFKTGFKLASQFETKGLTNVIILSDGHTVNGSDLVAGLQEVLPDDVIITGGLAGDGANFKTTLVGLNSPAVVGKVVALGFYGDKLKVGYGSVGGWDPFGVERLITKSDANVLYELDNKPALEVYKMYLGEYAKDLPGSALLFPLSIRTAQTETPLVRTILSIDEEKQSLTFAGNMPKGAYAQLMKANFDRLVEGSSNAATHTLHKNGSPDVALLISCVGRKLVLNQRIEEEIEVIREIYGDRTALTGFYSYGEISPGRDFIKCELHNQTMTITTLTES